jgi:hypothetical protein
MMGATSLQPMLDRPRTLARERDELRAEVERLRAALESLEFPGGRPCPWCLTPTGFVHGRHCVLADVLGRDKESDAPQEP